jgi:hypothetical protein
MAVVVANSYPTSRCSPVRHVRQWALILRGARMNTWWQIGSDTITPYTHRSPALTDNMPSFLHHVLHQIGEVSAPFVAEGLRLVCERFRQWLLELAEEVEAWLDAQVSWYTSFFFFKPLSLLTIFFSGTSKVSWPCVKASTRIVAFEPHSGRWGL